MSTTCGCEHCHSHGSSGLWMPTVSFVLLVIGLIGKYSGISWFAESWIEAIWFLVAFLPVGLPVMREAWEAALRKDFFSEFSLMGDRLDRGVLYWGVSRGRSRDAFLYGRREVATSSRE